MKYYKLLLDCSNENDAISYCYNTHGFEQYELKEGNLIKNWNDKITFYFDPDEGDKLTDYLVNNLGWLIVSKKFIEVMNILKIRDIQYLPVKIVNLKNNEIINDYKVVNIINVVDGLNLESSDYSTIELDGEKIYSIRKYALKKNKIKDENLFKLKGDEIPIFVSNAFKDLIDKNNITGCEFLEIKVI